ncbi:hypothetical protein PCASD_05590 [Puccinia coronata f. sp. avenae]|uniref:Uncharacterized protein n=1 Tax=Puccinia coronata f. sp. avenae TaxID=200324 RepID=A0A2N5UWZ4_9BASI|nr:hypothetical protein PCASD_05590 [Puccinia coronata f. sp. avenae]
MHNWRILTEEGRVELSHDVTFDKALYPGISTSHPAGFINPTLIEHLGESSEEIVSGQPSPSNGDSSQSSESGQESNYQLAEELNPSLSTNSRSGPGYDYVLQPVDQLAPKNISSSIDESNIITSKRRAHVALVDDDINFHIQCFHAGAQFFDQTLVAPKTYSKTKKVGLRQ